MGRIDDAFDDKLIDMAQRDRLRDSEGKVIPNWPVSPPPPEIEFGENTRPILPFNEDRARAHAYDGKAWDGTKTSYFRDLILIAEKNARANALRRAQLAGEDYMPPLAQVIPSRTEFLSGGVEGAVARSAQAALAVERRVRETRARLGKERPLSYRELRDISSGTGGVGLMPQTGAPMYISELFADAARAKARLAPRLFQGQLPDTSNIVLVPRATTGAAVAVQSAEAGAVNETNAVIDTASSPVITIIGMQDVSRQLLDRGVGVDAAIASSLGASFGAVLESQVINGSGSGGQLTGLLNVSGVSAVTYTDGTPTPAKTWGKVQELLSVTGTAYGAPVDTLALHTRRMSQLRNSQSVNVEGLGADAIETEAIPITLGGGTNEDRVIALALAETPVFIGPIRFQVETDVLSGTGQVRLLAYAYVAMVGARLPASIGVLSGTGLVAPTFP